MSEEQQAQPQLALERIYTKIFLLKFLGASIYQRMAA